MTTVYIQTYGCAHNRADSESMAGILEKEGYTIVDKKEDAKLVVINSCTVKDPSQKKFEFQVQEDTKKHKVIIAGCVPQADKENPAFSAVSAIGVKHIHKIGEVAQKTLAGEVVHELKNTPINPPLLTPVRRNNPFVEIIPVNSGCLGACTYCKTKHARGHLTSYTVEEIVEKAKRAIASGVKELWLTSEDLGAYGRDIGTNISTLAKTLLELEGEFRLRLGMANPPLMLNQIDKLIEILNHPKCFKFIHIPVQAGNDDVLEAMRREYTVQDFCTLVDALLAGVKDITIATDIIVGFPGETDTQFQETFALVKKYQFPVMNVSKFYARPGTPAAEMKQLPTSTGKERSLTLHEWFKTIDSTIHLVGKECDALLTARGDGDYEGYLRGRLPNYREVLVPKGDAKLGDIIRVKVIDTKRFFVVGERIKY